MWSAVGVIMRPSIRSSHVTLSVCCDLWHSRPTFRCFMWTEATFFKCIRNWQSLFSSLSYPYFSLHINTVDSVRSVFVFIPIIELPPFSSVLFSALVGWYAKPMIGFQPFAPKVLFYRQGLTWSNSGEEIVEKFACWTENENVLSVTFQLSFNVLKYHCSLCGLSVIKSQSKTQLVRISVLWS